MNKEFKNLYINVKVNMLITAIVIIGGINWGTSVFGFNFVTQISSFINRLLNTNYPIDKIIYIIVAISSILLAVRSSTWLPFLGRSVFPDSLVPLKVPTNTNNSIKIKTLPNKKVAYWASLPKGVNPDVVKAYDDYSNSGVVMSDNNGNAILPIVSGSDYIVPSGRIIPRHIHYRVLGLPYGMMSSIRTVNY